MWNLPKGDINNLHTNKGVGYMTYTSQSLPKHNTWSVLWKHTTEDTMKQHFATSFVQEIDQHTGNSSLTTHYTGFQWCHTSSPLTLAGLFLISVTFLNGKTVSFFLMIAPSAKSPPTKGWNRHSHKLSTRHDIASEAEGSSSSSSPKSKFCPSWPPLSWKFI